MAPIKLPVKDPRVEDLLLWRDTKKSGIVFAGITGLYLFLSIGSSSNIVSLLAKSLSYGVAAMLAWRMVGGVLKKPPPPLPRIITEGIAEAELRSYADRLAPIINQGLGFTNRALSGRDPVMSIIVACALYFFSRIAATMSLLTLAFLPVFAAFTLPKVYEMRKDEIDAGIDTARAKVTTIHDKYLASILAMIPKADAASPAESSSTMRKEE